MPNILKVTVDSPDEILNAGAYGTGAIVRVQSSATQAGAFADVTGTGSTPTIPVVTAIEVYSAYDPSGASTTWYRTRYENVGATRLSDWTSPFQTGDLGSAYASLALFRDYVRNQSAAATDADNDHQLLALEAAARAIDRECGRTFRLAADTTARVYTAGISTEDTSRYAVDIDDLFDTTGLTVAFDASGNGSYTTASTAWRTMPFNAPAQAMPYTSLLFNLGTRPSLYVGGVQVTAKWGWPSYPSGVVNANLIQAARFLKRRDSPFGIAGSPELGNELRLLARLDPDVAVLLAPWKLDWGYR